MESTLVHLFEGSAQSLKFGTNCTKSLTWFLIYGDLTQKFGIQKKNYNSLWSTIYRDLETLVQVQAIASDQPNILCWKSTLMVSAHPRAFTKYWQ
jgi:hypothetical protein